MIKSFACKETEKIFSGRFSKKLPLDIQRLAERKLVMLHYAKTLDDLRIPPANRLEQLSGDRQEQHSIRINRQWRICFVWREDGAHQVEITDYH
ncbi:MAG: type II toxin-antitoxin system RelE/ParE family toxin [Proteobacteria bacterium]|nr:type II toxin-antitoxin system RelE/ParE family toxin [Pseudomonadota bacterium]MBU0965000.1 type II toxin-antitoxin system RelE/ParE family toxin [Pseudomonadota bacterium]